jgi:hypothetical protein
MARALPEPYRADLGPGVRDVSVAGSRAAARRTDQMGIVADAASVGPRAELGRVVLAYPGQVALILFVIVSGSL